jgi:hypothetical protein
MKTIEGRSLCQIAGMFVIDLGYISRRSLKRTETKKKHSSEGILVMGHDVHKEQIRVGRFYL